MKYIVDGREYTDGDLQEDLQLDRERWVNQAKSKLDGFSNAAQRAIVREHVSVARDIISSLQSGDIETAELREDYESNRIEGCQEFIDALPVIAFSQNDPDSHITILAFHMYYDIFENEGDISDEVEDDDLSEPKGENIRVLPDDTDERLIDEYQHLWALAAQKEGSPGQNPEPNTGSIADEAIETFKEIQAEFVRICSQYLTEDINPLFPETVFDAKVDEGKLTTFFNDDLIHPEAFHTETECRRDYVSAKRRLTALTGECDSLIRHCEEFHRTYSPHFSEIIGAVKASEYSGNLPWFLVPDICWRQIAEAVYGSFMQGIENVERRWNEWKNQGKRSPDKREIWINRMAYNPGRKEELKEMIDMVDQGKKIELPDDFSFDLFFGSGRINAPDIDRRGKIDFKGTKEELVAFVRILESEFSMNIKPKQIETAFTANGNKVENGSIGSMKSAAKDVHSARGKRIEQFRKNLADWLTPY